MAEINHLTSWFNQFLVTGGADGFRRLRVDPAQTGFFEGREFRTFYEFNIPSGQSVIIKFSSAVDFILFKQSLEVDGGAIRLSAITGATESTAFASPLPVIGKNRMPTRRKYPTGSGFYETQIAINTGGTITGGTIVEVARVVSSNATAQQQTVGGQQSDERGLPAGRNVLSEAGKFEQRRGNRRLFTVLGRKTMNAN